jgi:hypothetical protein
MKTNLRSIAICYLLSAVSQAVFAQSTFMSYQGRLNDGTNLANGSYDLTFAFYSLPTGGSPLFGPVTNLNVAVSNGLFTTHLNVNGINPAIFNGGPIAAHFLEVDVRTNGSSTGFAALTPRQPLTSTPAALTATSLSGDLPTTQLSGTVANAQLANSSITVSAGIGLTGGGTVALGEALSLGTTATSANTPNAIVSRDASGGFSVGSVTLAGPLKLPWGLDLIESSGTRLMGADTNGNFFSGPSAGSTATSGPGNTAVGRGALCRNTSGFENIAIGDGALSFNTNGAYNTAIGESALALAENGFYNTAIGDAALSGATGNFNIGLGVVFSGGSGYGAGDNITTGNNNIEIGNEGTSTDNNTIRIGTQGTQTSTFIAGIYNTAVANGVSIAVNSSGQLGVLTISSARFKQDIRDMGCDSDILYSLKPVTFKYKPDIDPEGVPQFGLVAEEVEKVNPALVALDPQGKPYTVRYQAVDAMLLNEFLKEHRKVAQLESRLERLEQTINSSSGLHTRTAGPSGTQAVDFMSGNGQGVILNP